MELRAMAFEHDGVRLVAPRLSATILILRDTPRGMEVLMVVRHHEVDFLSGALVFPGGKVAKGDEDRRVHTRHLAQVRLRSAA